MKSLNRLIIALCASLLSSTSAYAMSFGTYDPRSLAMGGTGVSHANIDHAAYYNPALLSVAQEDDDFSLLLPTIGVRAYDPDDFLEALQDHQDGNYETAADNAFNNLDTAVSGGVPQEIRDAAQDAATSTQRLLDSYTNISGKTLDLEIHAGAGLAVPSKTLGIAISANGRFMSGIVLTITDADKTLIQKYVDEMNYVALNASANDTTLYVGGVPANGLKDIKPQLTSKANVRGALIIEGGLSLSHEFESLDKWSIGITPKTVQVDTYDYEFASVEDSEFDADQGKLSYTDTNIDIGLAKRISEGWKVGLVVKNAIKKEYKTVNNNIITIEPAARAGISHHTNWTTVALDLDLTENESIGLTGEKTQYAALGMEFDVALLQLRVGARHNLSAEAERESNTVSAGVGLYIFGLHVDAGVAGNDDELEAALQAGFQF